MSWLIHAQLFICRLEAGEVKANQDIVKPEERVPCPVTSETFLTHLTSHIRNALGVTLVTILDPFWTIHGLSKIFLALSKIFLGLSKIFLGLSKIFHGLSYLSMDYPGL
jgi:hypothetical protein